MEQITLRVSESAKESLQGEAEDNNQTLSDYLRDLLDARNEDTIPQEEYERLQSKHEKLQAEHDRVRAEVERVRDEKRQILAMREENRQLATYAEQDKQWHEASLATRLKWYVRGKE